METLSPSVDRIGAALKALRHAHARDPGGENEAALGLKCLHAVVAQLADEGVAPEDLKPLTDLEDTLRKSGSHGAGAQQVERRKGRPPSEVFLARVAAIIDLLVKAGAEEGEAGQIVMRWLLAAGVPAPSQGADARGWKRLLAWRMRLMHGLASDEAKDAYQEFTRQLEGIPAGERVRRVLDDQLWDRRRISKGAARARTSAKDASAKDACAQDARAKDGQD
jgi:hypothetical protein